MERRFSLWKGVVVLVAWVLDVPETFIDAPRAVEISGVNCVDDSGCRFDKLSAVEGRWLPIPKNVTLFL